MGYTTAVRPSPLVLSVMVAYAVSLLLRGVPGRIDDLWRLAQQAHPYVRFDHGGLLYLLGPTSVFAAFIAFLAPSWLIVGSGPRLGTTLARAVLLSSVLVMVLSTAVKLVFGLPLDPTVFIGAWTVVTLAAAGWRWSQPRSPSSETGSDFGISPLRAVAVAIATMAALAAMVPKIYWEDVHVDGVEAFEYGRSLTYYYLPHYDFQDGKFAFAYQLFMFMVPNHFFIQWFGPIDGAVRVQFFLYMGIVALLILELAEFETRRRLIRSEAWAIGAGVLVVGFVQAYATSYDVFSTDLSESPGLDLMWMVLSFGVISSLWTGSQVWVFAFALATVMASPGAPLLMAGLFGAVLLFGPNTDRRGLAALGAGTFGAVVGAYLHDKLYIEALLGDIKNQFSGRNLLSRIYPPSFTHWRRLSLLVFPSGIVPTLAMGWSRPNDPRTFVLTGLTLGFFAVIGISTWTGIHQFTPVMFLPLVIFGRFRTQRAPSTAWTAALVAGALISLVLSLPPHFKINQHARTVGYATRFELGDYEYGLEDAVAVVGVVSHVLPNDYRLLYPYQPWSADALVWLRYALDHPDDLEVPINYVVTSSTAPAPPGARLAGTTGPASIYVLDDKVMQEHLHPDYPRVSISPLYDHVLRQANRFFRGFAGIPEPSPPEDIDP